MRLESVAGLVLGGFEPGSCCCCIPKWVDALRHISSDTQGPESLGHMKDIHPPVKGDY